MRQIKYYLVLCKRAYVSLTNIEHNKILMDTQNQKLKEWLVKTVKKVDVNKVLVYQDEKILYSVSHAVKYSVALSEKLSISF